MPNPYISLLRTSWTYARGEKKRFALVYVMFVGANIIFSMNPLLFGWFIGRVQGDSGRIFHFTALYVAGFISLKFFQWCLDRKSVV